MNHLQRPTRQSDILKLFRDLYSRCNAPYTRHIHIKLSVLPSIIMLMVNVPTASTLKTLSYLVIGSMFTLAKDMKRTPRMAARFFRSNSLNWLKVNQTQRLASFCRWQSWLDEDKSIDAKIIKKASNIGTIRLVVQRADRGEYLPTISRDSKSPKSLWSISEKALKGKVGDIFNPISHAPHWYKQSISTRTKYGAPQAVAARGTVSCLYHDSQEKPLLEMIWKYRTMGKSLWSR